MKTGHQSVFDVRREFRSEGYSSAWSDDLGALDAPDVIAAGAHYKATSAFGRGEYALPSTTHRERI